MTTAVPWYYMWSDRYRIFHEMLTTSIPPDFEKRPIHLPQERFDAELYQTKGEHFWYASLIKVDTVLQCLREASEKGNSYIVFSDADIIVKPGVYDKLAPYMMEAYDMVFLKEGDHTNIGFLLLRVCDEVVGFWNMIRTMMKEAPGLDQTYINEKLPSFPGKYTHFSNQIFACTNTWRGGEPYVILQLLCSRIGMDSGFEHEYNMAEKIFVAAQHAKMEAYMEYVSPELIPYIYRVQEIIINAQQSASK
jgi:hypothetical protein